MDLIFTGGSDGQRPDAGGEFPVMPLGIDLSCPLRIAVAEGATYEE
jgi:hypothetical protein